MFNLAGRMVLIAGAASGIGSAIASSYAIAGARVYITDRDPEGAEQQAAAIHAAGGWAGYRHVAIKPTNGAPDPLDVAAAWNRCQRLQPGAAASWEMTLRIEEFTK